ncbi:MAG: glycyl-radical enzyme activating protein [Clostridia bacterium]|nr:glycyl-radical enzyme activating protein [Clostridia bacterium]
MNDGPGIRTTVFLKGCPLNCVWCHNPESKKIKPQLLYDARKCVYCGRCAEVCSEDVHIFENGKHIINREKCCCCGKCSEACFSEAIEIAGKEMTVEEVMGEVLRDKLFYDNSGGGLTLSGGEPMLQFEFAYALLKSAKENGLHTCIETCGFAPSEHFSQIVKLVDIFLFDYKLSDEQKHKEYTGVSNELIVKNLKMLDDLGANIILRCPIIPDVNDTPEHFKAIADMANSLSNISEINIEPYHPLGKSKSELLGVEYQIADLSFPQEETVLQWIDSVQSFTKTKVKKA